MTPTDDKPMTVDALMAMVQQFALAHFNPSLASTTLDEYRHSLRAAIEQYGREREAAGRGSGEPVAFVNRDELDNLLADGTGTIAGVRDGWRKTPLYAAPQPRAPLTDEQMARKFHETYERLAPAFGYETRPDTKAFDPESPNGKLMIAVCREIAHNIRSEG